MIEREIQKLLILAKQDSNFKDSLLKTKNSTDSVKNFCDICIKNGIQIFPGELVSYGETMSDAKMRSVNGGGAWEIDGWSDAYEDILAQLAFL